jgi:hypothetical protein
MNVLVGRKIYHLLRNSQIISYNETEFKVTVMEGKGARMAYGHNGKQIMQTN